MNWKNMLLTILLAVPVAAGAAELGIGVDGGDATPLVENQTDDTLIDWQEVVAEMEQWFEIEE